MTMAKLYQKHYDAAKIQRDNAPLGSDARAIAQVELNDSRSAMKRMIKAGWELKL